MIKLIINEVIKIYKRKKFLVVILMAFIISGLVIAGVYTSNNNMADRMSYEKREENIENYLKSEEEKLKREDLSKEEKERIKENIENIKLDLKTVRIEMENAKSEKWEDNLKLQKTNYEKALQNNDDDEHSRMQLKKIEYYLDNNIEPTYNYSNDAFNLFINVYTVMFMLFIPIITVIAGADIVSSEFNPETIKMLLIRPVERYKIVLSKYITLILFTVTYIFLTSVFILSIGGLLGGFQGALEPIIVGKDYTFVNSIKNGLEITDNILVRDSYSIIPIWKYILYAIIYSTFANIVLVTFSFFVSNLFRKTALNFIVTTATVLGGSIILQIFSGNIITKYIFLNYLTLEPVWNGQLQIQYEDPNIGIWFATTIFVVTTIIFLVSGILLFTKKEIKS